ncbi:hypothetical protein ACFCWD_37480 [Streptomyces sp. NPDC056374]|uniref:hypothetical protein n=1 Tax=unclassified Streptomyces TaxID=2593676 RepID=UPI0035D6E6A2
MKLKRSLISIVAAAGLIGFAAPTASADMIIVDGTKYNNCGGGFCLFFNSNQQGSYRMFHQSVSSFASGSTFNTVGTSNAGYGQGIWNNAASGAWWTSSSPCKNCANVGATHARVYFNSNYMGSYDQFNKPAAGNLHYTYNENASLYMY